MTTAQNFGELVAKDLVAMNGPLLTGKALWSALGFNNGAAFRQAKARGTLEIHVFNLPNRRGSYAYTREVADWLTRIRKEGSET